VGGDIDWGFVALLVAVIVPSIILHEVSHGAVANLLGDDTAKRAGRLTLNPIAHVDVFGTLILPAMMALSGVGAFGYAKPVPVNVSRLHQPRRDALIVSLAGPATNIILAVLATLLLRSVYADDFGSAFDVDDLEPITRAVFMFGFLNLLLATFNLLPIPPLDGSAVIERFIPGRWWPTWLKFRQWGFGILLAILLFAPGALDAVFDPVLDLWQKFLP
jgi:Zn-dependent protease